MTARDQRAHPQRGRGSYRWVFLILALAPVVAVIPLIVGNLLLGAIALVIGVVAGAVFIGVRDHGSRHPRKIRPIRHPEADITQENVHVTEKESAPALPPAQYQRGGGHRAGGYRGLDNRAVGDRASGSRVSSERAVGSPAAGSYGGGGGADVTGRPAAVMPSRPEPTPPPNEHATAGAGATPADPPVLDGGTAAGRSPWRLPVGQAQSGIAADAAQLGDLELRAASVIGPGHRCDEPATARQDAYALTQARSGSYLIVAVADGLSTSANSEIGARVAVSAAARTLHQALEASPDPDPLPADLLFRKVAGEMVGTGRDRKLDDHTLRSLLIVAVIPAFAQPDGSRQVWTAQVGDVSLWLHGRDGWSQQTGKAKSGLDRNKVDAALPFNPEQVVAGFVDVQPGQGVAVMTDGLADTLSDVAHAERFFAERWARPPHLAGFVSDLCFDARGQIDDRTAVVVWCGHDT